MEEKYSEHITMVTMLNVINIVVATAAVVSIAIIIIIMRICLENHQMPQEHEYFGNADSNGLYETPKDLVISYYIKENIICHDREFAEAL